MAQQLTTEILNAALENLTEKRNQIDEQIAEVRRMLGNGRNGRSATSALAARKHRISAAGRRANADGLNSAQQLERPRRRLRNRNGSCLLRAGRPSWPRLRSDGLRRERKRRRARQGDGKE